MPGRVTEWPAWAEYSKLASTEADDSDFLAVKKAIIAEYGVDALRKSWLKVCDQLKSVTDEIAMKGQSIIPVLDTAQVLRDGLSDDIRQEMKRVGAFVFRQTVDNAEATKLYGDLKQYLEDNKGSIQAWPKESPSMFIMYNSPTQNTLRAHPNQLRLQRILNGLWHDYTAETSPEPLVYLDGVRDRAPQQTFLGLGPHIDAGSLCRWADPTYRKWYSKVFSGYPELHDSYSLAERAFANQELYKGIAHSSVFRTFQGWTALTRTAPSEGTIMVYPNVSTAIAYVLLRPFFTPPPEAADVMDAEKWTIDDSNSWFPGTFKPQSQRLSRISHPHLRLEECLVHMPKIEAGDTVWWHTDLCHAVDTIHNGTANAAVAYIAACPTTPLNKEYVRGQLAATLEGRPPADYAEDNDLDESTLKGYVGLDGISEVAKRSFGFDL
ncbi:hypothetical protein VTL71DRAFT_2984 [Oculimacula yallundae]|uniref:DUF1479-domain-containing protein n=1 Tax=Oculimacula yallundae TaxID=86028 RepID=A0ABR4C5X9_9HELO